MRTKKVLKFLSFATLLLFALSLSAFSEEALPRFSSKSVLNIATSYVEANFPGAEKTNHRTFILPEEGYLVLINFTCDEREGVLHGSLLLEEDGSAAWFAVDNEMKLGTSAPFSSFYVSKTGKCYHRRLRCSNMKSALFLPEFAVPLVNRVIRPCKRCLPQYILRK